jgi:hypothetical protein
MDVPLTSFALPLTPEPMEARAEAKLPVEGGPWQYEPKWGWRPDKAPAQCTFEQIRPPAA